MKNNITELVFILDKSGSMAGLEEDTIGGFNATLAKQKDGPGDAVVSTVLFDHEAEVIHDRVPLSEVQPLTGEQYFVRGSTALIDALGGAIRHIGNIHKYAREEDMPEHTLFVITTDGRENSSRRFTAEQVRAMVSRQQEKYGWEFLFLGANIDAVETARRYGIRRENAVDYHSDRKGTALLYQCVSEAVTSVRMRMPAAAPDHTWRKRLDDDFRGRRPHR